ncbi:hypothetical protein [Aliiglaciecola lipolytica]|uniref:Aerotolerance regulator N-terminal domain-containing protein n=1 Tax=Aliiglaciecola lipolytica E3 TaxID=1127673 RepID=K6XRG0_9ALTE|nr:hypothetical protein [Aliiglaciecola lipolytica]GAC14271.1 hypothetical protein GLIP_1638 [Aliiglaciecola lipolytica E3]
MSVELFSQVHINFLPGFPVWVSYFGLILLILTFGYCLPLIFKRVSKQGAFRKWLVVILNLVLFVNVIALLSDIQVKRTHVSSATLITVGADLALVEKQLTEHDSKLHSTFVLANSDLINSANESTIENNWQVIHQPEQLLFAKPQLQQLTVIGDGLSEQQWNALQALSQEQSRVPLEIHFAPSTLRSGPIEMRWIKRLVIGEYQKISGKLRIANVDDTASLRKQIYQVSLLQPDGEILETKNLRDGEAFQFSFPVSVRGQWLYTLTVTNTGTSAPEMSENIAFSVEQNTPPNILIVQSAPSFETKHFKNWASQFNTKLTSQTQISQNKYITQYLNTSKKESEEQGLDSLSSYDLLLIDGRALLGLSEEYRNAISRAINAGLGILIIADQSLITDNQNHQFTILSNIEISTEANDSNTISNLLRWSQIQTAQPISYLNANLTSKHPRLKNYQALVTDTQNKPVVLNQNVGLGNVAISLVNNSYQWQLSGEEQTYSQYWQYLIGQISRPSSEVNWLPIDEEEVAYVNDPLRICALGNNNVHSAYYQGPINSSTENLKRTLLLAPSSPITEKQCSVIWPESQGWYTRSLNPADANQTIVSQSSFYVYSKQQWSSWQQSGKHAASQRQVQQSTAAIPKEYLEYVSKYPFWWMFIVVVTLLWIERKY